MPPSDVSVNKDLFAEPTNDIEWTAFVTAAFQGRIADLLRLQGSDPKAKNQDDETFHSDYETNLNPKGCIPSDNY